MVVWILVKANLLLFVFLSFSWEYMWIFKQVLFIFEELKIFKKNSCLDSGGRSSSSGHIFKNAKYKAVKCGDIHSYELYKSLKSFDWTCAYKYAVHAHSNSRFLFVSDQRCYLFRQLSVVLRSSNKCSAVQHVNELHVYNFWNFYNFQFNQIA